MIFDKKIVHYASGRDNNFNLLRMLAAFGVLVSHAYPLSLGPDAIQPLQEPLQGITLGTVSVYIFFAISGFFITKSFLVNTSWKQFLAARALRLFPALIVVLGVTVLVAGIFYTQATAAVFWADVPRYLLFNTALVKMDYDLPGVFEATPFGPTINGSLWTLFYEVVCYMGVFIAGMLGLLRGPKLASVTIGLAIAACLIIPFTSSPDRLLLLAKLGLPFALGAGFFIWRSVIPVSPVIAIGLCVFPVLTYDTILFSPTFVLTLSYMSLFLGFYDNAMLRQYNRLGDYSYGIYIYAFPIQQCVAQSGVTDPVWNMLVATPLTVLCATLSWHIIERPALRLKRSHT